MTPAIPSTTNAVNYGMAVDLRLKNGRRLILRNVTEIHYNFPSAATAVIGQQCAFESNIHCDGVTYPLSMIVEFETYRETEKRPNFLPV